MSQKETLIHQLNLTMPDLYALVPVNILGLIQSNHLGLKWEYFCVSGDGAFDELDFLPQPYNDEDGS